MEKVLTTADAKKIKQALYDLAATQPYVDLLESTGEDMEEIKALRENARRNLTKYLEFIDQQQK